MRGISFSAPMVMALMDGRKTQTRRVIEPQPFYINGAWQIDHKSYTDDRWCYDSDDLEEYLPEICPYGVCGDVLYVQEGYQVDEYHDRLVTTVGHYLADNAPFTASLNDHEHDLLLRRKHPFRATPGRFMYRSLARNFIELTGVRVERLWDISEADARAEGALMRPNTYATYDKLGCHLHDGWSMDWSRVGEVAYGIIETERRIALSSPQNAFRSFWITINGERYPWKSDPLLWVLSFKRVEG